MRPPGPQLSGVRTFLFWGLAVVWFVEMLFMGFPSLSKVWTALWQVIPPEDPGLVTALSMTWAVAAPAKGAFFVMAVIGLRSRSASVRTALFASMALVPPLNIAFPFRQQGFLPGPVAVATVLSGILWGSFFLFPERTPQQPEQVRPSGSRQSPPPAWQTLQSTWFAANSAILTLIALLSLFATSTALGLKFPCLSALLNGGSAPASLIHTDLANGTHMLALATASWIATAQSRGNPPVRTAVALASTVHAALMCAFPLRQIVAEQGARCATTSILMIFVPLLAGWVLHVGLASRSRPATTAPLPA